MVCNEKEIYWQALAAIADAHFALIGPHHCNVAKKDLSEDKKKIDSTYHQTAFFFRKLGKPKIMHF